MDSGSDDERPAWLDRGAATFCVPSNGGYTGLIVHAAALEDGWAWHVTAVNRAPRYFRDDEAPLHWRMELGRLRATRDQLESLRTALAGAFADEVDVEVDLGGHDLQAPERRRPYPERGHQKRALCALPIDGYASDVPAVLPGCRREERAAPPKRRVVQQELYEPKLRMWLARPSEETDLGPGKTALGLWVSTYGELRFRLTFAVDPTCLVEVREWLDDALSPSSPAAPPGR